MLSPAPEEPYDAATVHLLSEIGYLSLPPPPQEPDSLTKPGRFTPLWADILKRAVQEPGLLLDVYTRFHGYSLGNRLAALIQCEVRRLEPGPLNTYPGWKALGRKVKAGEKAISLCMPLKGKTKRAASTDAPADETTGLLEEEEVAFIRAFAWKPHWFVLSQTEPLEGEDDAAPLVLETPALGAWHEGKALGSLNIQRVPFDHPDGNAQGFARERSVAVSPLAALPYKTLFHEIAHVVLGHTQAGELSDTRELTQSLIEVEAESVALLLLSTFDLPGQDFCRGYIQHWLRGQEISEKSAKRIFGTTEQILNAGVGAPRERILTAREVGAIPQAASQATSLPAATFSETLTASPLSPTLDASGGRSPPPFSTASPAPSSPVFLPETEAWSLHARLSQLHAALHPADPATQAGWKAALRHLHHCDPQEAHEIRALVKDASRLLKTAGQRIERLLDSEPEGESPTIGRQVSDTTATPVEATPPAPSPTLPQSGLSPTRAAAARRSVGRGIRSELESEKKRFFAVAERRGLPTNAKAGKAMLQAIALYLQTPLESRRDLSAHQWAKAANGVEAGELTW